MKIVIVGAGAVGSILAANLIWGGADVACVARGTRAQQLREKGLRIRGLDSFDAPVRVIEDPAQVREAELLVFATKTYDLQPALEAFRHVAPARVVGLQNGVQKNEQVAGVFGLERTLGGVAEFGGEVLADGTVSWTIYERLAIGLLPQGVSEEVDGLGEALNRAGFRTEVSPRIQTIEWSKFVVFAGLMPVAVLSRLPTHRMFRDPDLGRISLALFKETAQIAAKLGIELEDAGGMTQIRSVTTLPEEQALELIRQSGVALEARGAQGHKVSTLQDLERSRRFEVEEILGYALRKGASLGLPMPVSETCYRLVTGVERNLR